jgi:hypothetical protein
MNRKMTRKKGHKKTIRSKNRAGEMPKITGNPGPSILEAVQESGDEADRGSAQIQKESLAKLPASFSADQPIREDRQASVSEEGAKPSGVRTGEEDRNRNPETSNGVTDAGEISPSEPARPQAKGNLRYLSGDADAAYLGNPRGFLKVGQAVKELWNVTIRKEEATPEMKEWLSRDGTEPALPGNEVEGLGDIWFFMRAYEKEGVKPEDIPYRIWKKYWLGARLSSEGRETLLRYANFLSYLEQMRGSPDGLPKNFGASVPEEVMALPDLYDRAYLLASQLLGH